MVEASGQLRQQMLTVLINGKTEGQGSEQLHKNSSPFVGIANTENLISCTILSVKDIVTNYLLLSS